MTNKYLHDSFTHNVKAAGKIVPFLMQVLKIESVVDVGCGTGTWLKVCIEHDIRRVVGIEGHHLDLSKLEISKDHIRLHDLETNFDVSEKFDLAISLEVAEHLQPKNARSFVSQLTSFSDHVYFSAAIPYQGGQNHINEKEFSYWVELFKENGFQPYDIIRPRFWDDPDIEFWYVQNSCLFIKATASAGVLDSYPTFHNKDIVHPSLLQKLGQYRDDILRGNVSFAFIVKLLLKKFLFIFRGR